MSAAATNCTRSSAKASSTPLLADEGQRGMSAGTFKAAMIQMRSGLTPAANIEAAVR